MSSALDKTLDDVISSRSKSRRRSTRRSAKATLVGSTATTAVKTAKRARKAAPTAQKIAPYAQKIIVSNLPLDVNEAQVKELFTQSIGPTKEVTLNYDHNGRSKGVASVVFTRSGDGARAHKEYNNRLIDGKRQMKVEIVLDPSDAPPPTLSERVGPAPASTKVKESGVARRKRGAKTRRRKGANKSEATLDAEMADYTGENTTAATTT